MITKNDFNSEWWGDPVGILRDPAFFRKSAGQQKKLLKEFSWVEFRSTQIQTPALWEKLRQAGFFYADTLMNFRIALDRITGSADLQALGARSALQRPFAIKPQAIAPFKNERFNLLPGKTPERIARRYACWSNNLIKEYPGYCLSISWKNETQGWFLSRPSAEGLNLTLAMLAKGAGISGMLLYQKALLEYSRLGLRLGWASFSVRNTAVLNIYSRLGAHFLCPEYCWFWVNRK